jgi:hypothetical protein
MDPPTCNWYTEPRFVHPVPEDIPQLLDDIESGDAANSFKAASAIGRLPASSYDEIVEGLIVILDGIENVNDGAYRGPRVETNRNTIRAFQIIGLKGGACGTVCASVPGKRRYVSSISGY